MIRYHNYETHSYDLSVNDLEISEQYEFASHLIEYFKRDLDSIYENESYEDIVSSLIQLLKHDSLDNKLNFSDIVMEKVVDHYKPNMQKMIDDVIGWIEREDREEKGFVSRRDRINGETHWYKA